MSGDPGQFALDGRANGPVTLLSTTGKPLVVQDNQVLPYRPVKHYRPVTDSRDRNVARNSGTLGAAGYGGPPAGQVWDTPSMCDHSTVSGEIWDVSYIDAAGKDWTGSDILIELFKDLQKRQASA